MLTRFGRFTYRRRWAIIAAWLVVFTGSGVIAPGVTGILKSGGYTTPTSAAGRAYDAVAKAYGYRALAFTAVFTPGSGTSIARAYAAAQDFRRSVRLHLSREIVAEKPVMSGDGRIVFVRVFTPPRTDLGIPLTARIRVLIPRIVGVRGYITGASAIFYDMERASDDDLRRMEIITFPFALVILLIIFGTLVGAFVPVSMGPLAVTAALAAIFLLGHVMQMSIFVLNTASMLGLGVAIDYSLFMVQRFREELEHSRDVEAAVGITVATSGKAILISALTVAVGFLGMTLFRVNMLTSLGIGGSVVVAISLVAALTLLPAILSVLGARVNKFAIVPRRLNTAGLWTRLSTFVMKRPWRVVAAVAVIIIILALPARSLHVGVPGPAILPASAPSRVGDTLLQVHIGLANESPVLVVLQSSTGFRSPATRLGLFQLAGQICVKPIVAGVAASPVVNSSRMILPCRIAARRASSLAGAVTVDPHTVLISVYIHGDPSSVQAEGFVRYLRSLRPPPGVNVLIGGQTAAQLDFDSFVYGQFPLAILFVVLSIVVILAVSFRSVLLPIKAVLMNGFSVLAAYGATVLVFQDGYLHSLFGFTPTGSLDSIVPVFLFCVLFGLSTDYEVFLLTRIREEYDKTGDNTHSVALGLERTGKMITSAALIMVV
ncbi:MAG TPA: MMPL family transporter, partial [Chloroflexota bacterium]|nr:MMPL family transporter [Chloroflexota bacterium]